MGFKSSFFFAIDVYLHGDEFIRKQMCFGFALVRDWFDLSLPPLEKEKLLSQSWVSDWNTNPSSVQKCWDLSLNIKTSECLLYLAVFRSSQCCLTEIQEIVSFKSQLYYLVVINCLLFSWNLRLYINSMANWILYRNCYVSITLTQHQIWLDMNSVDKCSYFEKLNFVNKTYRPDCRHT